ncbi:alpha-glucuronidase family glycosyl hydrolase [Flavobacterium hibernum]|uniref:Xylan alpha-1,2-glucuronidase n=1 Tax=Flavobacterium hibernum TaxID=37752 RepID=A0A0D0ET09_9FLAO|nr:alpha-glucuronidase family glycosyl hydrolase [Flavobacterium hibernum]KIO51583.1 alpha-glucuronidase [Flavobacterium hibernum]OXA83317.1 alpha-glucuronidase [Flavobacterium hibernum]STO11220.1 Alpha-glucuronidase [Flavobacterium hibernum]
MTSLRFFFWFLLISFSASAQKDYKLWLQYHKIQNAAIASEYKSNLQGIVSLGSSATSKISLTELETGISDMLGNKPEVKSVINGENNLIFGAQTNLNSDLQKIFQSDFTQINNEGFIIKSVLLKNKKQIVITGKNDVAVLYGVYSFLRLMQTNKSIKSINIVDAPKTNIRILNHWDNLDRTVERGYAGFSLWNWQKLPDFIDQRYIDYARANASIGINGTVLTNVNANALILTPQYLEKVTALANVFRPYGIKVYLTARFSAPIEIGGLKTADPKDTEVANWWKEKAKEIYKSIPDFGGFLVKANSEGQPGPQNYGRDHVDGANMLADAVAPFGGVIMWRAFVYSEHDANDRAKQAYAEFQPYDGKFRDNVIVQVKNGAIDFQPREPFHPLFGAMPKTPLMMEFQITQEYLGFSTHLVFLPKLFQEVLESETYQKGKGSTIAKVIDGSLNPHKLTGIAGVSNIGNDLNWTGHPFAQANWYGFGRLAWNPYLDAEIIADEWLRATFSNDENFIKPVKDMMLTSREAVVNYMTPLGLHHIMDTGHHYGPGPWVSNLSRPEWNPTYYHKADKNGIGFDRSKTGTNATAQYAAEGEKIFDNLETCPEKDLLWFHHVSWDYKLKSGQTLWNGMALKYQEGVNQVKEMQNTWSKTKKYVDSERYKEVEMLLAIQYKEAKWWRDACLLYFQQYSGKELPVGVEKSTQTLEYFKSLKFPFAPGN